LDPFLTPYPQINLKWIKDLNVRVAIIKLLEEKEKLLDIGLDNDFFFLPIIPKAQTTKAKINKGDYKCCANSFCTTKETTNKIKVSLQKWEKYLSMFQLRS
jgi:hypothetical protein